MWIIYFEFLLSSLSTTSTLLGQCLALVCVHSQLAAHFHWNYYSCLRLGSGYRYLIYDILLKVGYKGRTQIMPNPPMPDFCNQCRPTEVLFSQITWYFEVIITGYYIIYLCNSLPLIVQYGCYIIIYRDTALVLCSLGRRIVVRQSLFLYTKSANCWKRCLD